MLAFEHNTAIIRAFRVPLAARLAAPFRLLPARALAAAAAVLLALLAVAAALYVAGRP